MFDEQDSEINLAIGMVLAVAIFVSIMVIGVALSVSGSFSAPAAAAVGSAPAASDTVAAPAAPGAVKIYFEVGSAALPTTASGDLAPIVESLGRQSGARAVISGFHDASGDAAQNAELAKRRATTVRDALASAGIAADRITLEKPQVTTGGADAAEARRVEVSVR